MFQREAYALNSHRLRDRTLSSSGAAAMCPGNRETPSFTLTCETLGPPFQNMPWRSAVLTWKSETALCLPLGGALDVGRSNSCRADQSSTPDQKPAAAKSSRRYSYLSLSGCGLEADTLSAP